MAVIPIEFPARSNFDVGGRFRPTIDEHDKFDWTRWREEFAGNAAPLAKLFVEQFSKLQTKPHTAEHVEKTLVTPYDEWYKTLHVGYSEAYDPFRNWWCGRWANSRVQFHIWDFTQAHGGRHIQPVTQSEKAFADEKGVDAMLKASPPKADLAINVVSQLGLTGWVSKKQHGIAELPHVGYILARGELIWIARALTDSEYRWFMFYERATTSGDERYEIDGVRFTLDVETKTTKDPDSGTHYGKYYYHDPYDPDGTSHCEKSKPSTTSFGFTPPKR
jgi:hypothetical protein